MNETLTRTLSGAVYIVILVVSALNSISYIALLGIFLLIAVFEFCELTKLDKVIPLCTAMATYAIFWGAAFDPTLETGLLLLTLIVSVKLVFFLYSTKTAALSDRAKYVYLAGYVILPMIITSKLPFANLDYNPWIIVGIFILIWANDTFAFLVGKAIGKHKLFERISPKKTIEGFIGGMAFALLFSLFVSFYMSDDSWHHWVIIAVIVSVFGTIGDLIESKFKRIAGVKDSGRIMPGHGGILDRLDSVIFVAPFVFLFYQITNYVS